MVVGEKLVLLVLCVVVVFVSVVVELSKCGVLFPEKFVAVVVLVVAEIFVFDLLVKIFPLEQSISLSSLHFLANSCP